MTALLSPRQAPDRPTRPDLTPVPAPRRQLGMGGFVVVMALVLAVGMVGVLVLTTVLQGQAFEVERRQAEARSLSNRVSDLEAQLAQAESIQNLGVKAQKLGMRPNTYPVQLRLPDGTVVGKPTRVVGGEVPSVRYVTPQQAAKELQQRHEAEAKKKAEAEAKKKAAAEAKAKKKAEAEAKKKAAEAASQAEATQQPAKSAGERQ
ncbi:MAG: hypothetical protein VB093_06125 [Propionicimonas sp.]|nr:hypothetical protein [Propionicimonas sp.]